MSAGGVVREWECPRCGWVERAHPFYGWARHNERAVAVHRALLCPGARRERGRAG